MENLVSKVKKLQMAVVALISLNLFFLVTSYKPKESKHEKFEEISVDRINIVDKKGVTKMVIASQDMLRKDSKDPGVSEGFTYSGMLFRNEEGEECGGLIFNGKKTKTGQSADAGLTLDQYNQDQNVVIEHNETVDRAESSIKDGLTVIQRPDYTKRRDEYKKYEEIDKLMQTTAQKDSLRTYYATQGVTSRRRLFVGIEHGVKSQKSYNEAGLFIRNKAGANAIKLYVDDNNIPHFEVYDLSGKKKVYELDLKEKK
ncbi:hypothetical protein [Spirosoma pollinicola]|uniref:Uncharacterized protein n=1 Tax=Spirosoma pollinicola TaxID=2057025 RepID=A0A2K8Z2G6_9BACT|nr:hypothetical protein [Spirosoma pollinicola]AUD04072.1 hypothetical protein CWM47_20910 [Spirosoma pollinicola]